MGYSIKVFAEREWLLFVIGGAIKEIKDNCLSEGICGEVVDEIEIGFDLLKKRESGN